MATKFVRSAATGTADGSSWANAYTTLAAGLSGSAAGDTIFVADDHAETNAAAVTLTAPGTAAAPNLILCADHTVASPGPSDLKLTGSVSANTINFAGCFYCYGSTFTATAISTAALSLGFSASAWQKFVNCLLSSTATAASNITIGAATSRIELVNTPLKFGTTASTVRFGGSVSWKLTPSAIQGSAPTSLVATNTVAALVQLEGVDLSALTGTIVAAPTAQQMIDFKDCAVSASAILAANPTIIGPRITSTRTDSGATNYKTAIYTYRGTQSSEIVVVRTGGSTDGTSLKVVTTANVSWHSHFEASPLVTYNASTAANRTITVRGLINAAALPNNDQIWIDAEYLGSATTPLGFQAIGTKANVLAAGAAVAADTTSAWDSVAPARANSQSYAVGAIIKVASNAGRVFFCTAAGTSAASEPSGYANAVDGGTITDGSATFRAAVRFALTVTLSAPSPQQAGYIYVYPKVGAASSTFYLDGLITLS